MNQEAKIDLRSAKKEDGAAMWSLVKNSGKLDINSCYLYLLLGHHFSDTCVVAESGDEMAGFLSAYRPPNDASVLFVWQIAIDIRWRQRGLGTRILEYALDRQLPRGVKFLEATVSPSNAASMRLFRSLAERRGVKLTEKPLFTADLFGPSEHETEVLFRLGPFD